MLRLLQDTEAAMRTPQQPIEADRASQPSVLGHYIPCCMPSCAICDRINALQKRTVKDNVRKQPMLRLGAAAMIGTQPRVHLCFCMRLLLLVALWAAQPHSKHLLHRQGRCWQRWQASAAPVAAPGAAAHSMQASEPASTSCPVAAQLTCLPQTCTACGVSPAAAPTPSCTSSACQSTAQQQQQQPETRHDTQCESPTIGAMNRQRMAGG